MDATPDTAPPAYSSPNEDNTAADESTLLSQQQEMKDVKEEPDSTQATAFSAAPAAVASTVKSAAADTYQDLKDKLAKAEATIASLRDEAASGLRQRKTAAGSEDKGAAAPRPEQLAQAQRQGTEGVPVQIVAILCLVSFLLAYFFF